MEKIGEKEILMLNKKLLYNLKLTFRLIFFELLTNF